MKFSKVYGDKKKMRKKFLKKKLKDKKSFYSFLDSLENCKVGFYSVGLYPASLA